MVLAPILLSWAGQASAQAVRITKLKDTDFGAISNISADAVRSQNVCVFSAIRRYNVVASGSGNGGAFVVNSGNNNLAYEVQWNSASGQSAGTMLIPGVPLSGLTSVAINPHCSRGLATSASLIVILRRAALEAAIAGTYSGILTRVIASE